MINISPSAAKEIRRLLSKQQENAFFRLQVKNGGCSGLFYNMTFDNVTVSSERVYDCSGIPVVVDAHKLNYISGLLIDYSEDLMGGSFRFHNPQAIAVCGCGNSFSVNVDP